MNTCAWCNKNIPEDNEVFGLGAKLRPEIDFEDQEGTIIPLFLAIANKMVMILCLWSVVKDVENVYKRLFKER